MKGKGNTRDIWARTVIRFYYVSSLIPYTIASRLGIWDQDGINLLVTTIFIDASDRRDIPNTSFRDRIPRPKPARSCAPGLLSVDSSVSLAPADLHIAGAPSPKDCGRRRPESLPVFAHPHTESPRTGGAPSRSHAGWKQHHNRHVRSNGTWKMEAETLHPISHSPTPFVPPDSVEALQIPSSHPVRPPDLGSRANSPNCRPGPTVISPQMRKDAESWCAMALQSLMDPHLTTHTRTHSMQSRCKCRFPSSEPGSSDTYWQLPPCRT